LSVRNARWISCVSVCLVAASPCFAQTAAQMTGRITDQSDAVVPGAAVEVVSVDRGTAPGTALQTIAPDTRHPIQSVVEHLPLTKRQRGLSRKQPLAESEAFPHDERGAGR
jgi:hypothetical protein